MTQEPDFILKDDGFPATALLRGAKAVTIHPQNQGAWICLGLATHPHESPAVCRQYAECLPAQWVQLCLDPMTAHQLGLYLIEKAKAAIAPDGG